MSRQDLQQELLDEIRNFCKKSELNSAEIAGLLDTVKIEFTIGALPLVTKQDLDRKLNIIHSILKKFNDIIQGEKDESKQSSVTS